MKDIMKKILTLFLVPTIVMSFTGCSNEKPKDDEELYSPTINFTNVLMKKCLRMLT